MGNSQSHNTTFHKVTNSPTFNEHRLYTYYFFPGMKKGAPNGIEPQFSLVNGWINRRLPNPDNYNAYVCDDSQWVSYVLTPKNENIVSAFTNEELLAFTENYDKSHLAPKFVYKNSRIEFMPPISVTTQNEEYIMAQIQPPYEVEHYMDQSFWDNNYRGINAGRKNQYKFTICHVFGGNLDGNKIDVIRLPHEPNRVHHEDGEMILPDTNSFSLEANTTTKLISTQPTAVSMPEKKQVHSQPDIDDDDVDVDVDIDDDLEESKVSVVKNPNVNQDKNDDEENETKEESLKSEVSQRSLAETSPALVPEKEKDFAIQFNGSHDLNTILEANNRVHFTCVVVVKLTDTTHLLRYQEFMNHINALQIHGGVHVLVVAYDYIGDDGAAHISLKDFEKLAAPLTENASSNHSVTFEYSDEPKFMNHTAEKIMDKWLLNTMLSIISNRRK